MEKQKMRDPWLIQRLNGPALPNPFSFGGGLVNGGLSNEVMDLLKRIFSFDYMGAAEFEFGALPTALNALIDHRKKETLTTGVCILPEGVVYLICPREILSDVKDWLRLAAKNDHPATKEYVGLHHAIKGKGDIKGWIKIESERYCKHPFMFFVDENMYDSTCKLFELETVPSDE